MRIVRLLLVLALLGLAGWQGALLYRAAVAASAKPPRIPTAKADRGDLPLTLAGYGTLEASQTFLVRNRQVDTQIVDIVQDGVLVTKGQVIVQLDRTTIEKELRDRKLAYENARAQTKKVDADAVLNAKNADTKMLKAQQEQGLLLSSNRADLEQAQAQVAFDHSELDFQKRDLERKRNLAKDLLVPAVDVETADLAVKSKEVLATQGERQLDVKGHQQRSAVTQGEMLISDAKFSAAAAKNKAGEQTANAGFNEQAARRLLELSQMQLKWCELRAPASGLTVLAREYDRVNGAPRPLRPGDPAYPSRQFMSIIDLSRMRIVAEMSEMDVSQIKVGETVRVWPRSAPDEVLKGRMAAISNLARQGPIWRRNAVPGKKTFRVLVEILQSRPDLLRPGMTADFEVLQGQMTNAVRVPLQALFQTTRGTSVFVKKGRRYVAVPVKTGPRNANYAAILSGLKGGEEIALKRPPLALLREPPARDRKLSGFLRRTLGVLF